MERRKHPVAVSFTDDEYADLRIAKDFFNCTSYQETVRLLVLYGKNHFKYFVFDTEKIKKEMEGGI